MDIITIKEVKTLADNHELKFSCSNCNVRDLCMPAEAQPDLLKKLDELVYIRKRLKSAAVLYHTGGRFHALYAVKTGFIKTESLHDDGRVQITGFYMAGEVFGFDGIATDEHTCTAMALEDSEICIIPLDRVRHAGHQFEAIQHHFYKLMSREIVRDHTIMMLLGSMQGEERLAAFMLNLSQRFHARGYSRFDLVLRMKREEIGSYLGMKVETVSRIFTKFQEQGLLDVHQKNIKIINLQGLMNLIDRQHTS
jgi:CRP/FNR family transcriptional regulator